MNLGDLLNKIKGVAATPAGGVAVRKAGGGFTRKAVRAIPLVGDVVAAGLEFTDTQEPVRKNALDALIVGGGGALTSAATAGLDFIPQVGAAVLNTTNPLAQTFLRRTGEESKLRKAINDATYAINYADPTNWLTAASDKIYYGKDFGIQPGARSQQIAAHVAAQNAGSTRVAQREQKTNLPVSSTSQTGSDTPKQPNAPASTSGSTTNESAPLTNSPQLRVSITPENLNAVELAVNNYRIMSAVQNFNTEVPPPTLKPARLGERVFYGPQPAETPVYSDQSSRSVTPEELLYASAQGVLPLARYIP